MLTRIRKCLALLPPAERWRWAGLIPLALLAAGLEALGAAVVFALIKIVGDPAAAGTLPVISRLEIARGGRTTIVAAVAFVGLFYLFKNAVLTAVAAMQSRVTSDSVVAVSRRMLRGYLTMPFVYHLRRNSAELISNSTYSVQNAFREAMESIFSATTEACIAAAIVAVLLIQAPVLTLVAITFLCTLLAGTLTFTRRALARWGRAEQVLRGQLLQTLQEALHGVKDVKIRGRERYYYETFAQRQRALGRVQSRNATLSAVSRLIVETLFVFAVLLVILVTALRPASAVDVVPVLGLYAYAGLRVIPSVNRILMHLGRIQYGSAAVDALYADCLDFREQPDEDGAAQADPVTLNHGLALNRVSFSYGERAALQDIDLTVLSGESIGIVGPTGAGKSTLIDLVLGLLQPAAGQITADGTDIFTALGTWQRRIGYVPQAVYLIDDTVRRNVAFGLSDEEIDDAKVREAVQMAQLDAFLARTPHGLDTVIGERGTRLSGGERQRIAIARALYPQPDLLVFDEATAALDGQTERELTRAIESLHGKKTMLIIAHRLSTVRSCERLVLLHNGRIEAEGTFDELVERSAHFRTLARADHGAD